MSETVTLFVKKGTKVDVKEVDQLPTNDSRVNTDRDALLVGSEKLKIAITKSDGYGNVTAQSAFMTMCG